MTPTSQLDDSPVELDPQDLTLIETHNEEGPNPRMQQELATGYFSSQETTQENPGNSREQPPKPSGSEEKTIEPDGGAEEIPSDLAMAKKGMRMGRLPSKEAHPRQITIVEQEHTEKAQSSQNNTEEENDSKATRSTQGGTQGVPKNRKDKGTARKVKTIKMRDAARQRNITKRLKRLIGHGTCGPEGVKNTKYRADKKEHTRHRLVIMTINVESLPSNKEMLELCINDKEIHVIVVVEQTHPGTTG